MSHKYPCIYYDNGKCQKFSDDHYTAWCDFDSCESRKPSNGDRIRAMSDEELTHFKYGGGNPYCKEEEPTDCRRSKWVNGLSPCEQCYLEWLKQPYKEDT